MKSTIIILIWLALIELSCSLGASGRMSFNTIEMDTTATSDTIQVQDSTARIIPGDSRFPVIEATGAESCTECRSHFSIN